MRALARLSLYIGSCVHGTELRAASQRLPLLTYCIRLKFTATSNGGGAAIGGASSAEGHVTITGGTVNATAEERGAAIGGGRRTAGHVTITGGTITAMALTGAAIGGGGADGAPYDYSGLGFVVIKGGI